MPKKLKISKGDVFNRLTIIKEVPKTTTKRRFLVKCECGKSLEVELGNIKSGLTKSCGCSRSIAATRHGYTKSNPRLYRIYKNMVSRCSNKKSTSFRKYGGVGTTVCEEWRNNISKFIEWSLSNGYSDTLVIDRIDNTLGYNEDNCRWVTIAENNRNILRCNLGATKVRGVNPCPTTGRYRATISINNKSVTIGRADTIKECAIMRNDYIDKNNLTHIKSEVCSAS